MKSDVGKKRIDEVIKDSMNNRTPLQSGKVVHSPEDAASKFVEVLKNSINTSGLSDDAVNAVSNIESGNATASSRNKYIIRISFAGDLTRPSLDEEKYGSIEDIVMLLNNGVDHTMRRVHGMWHGKETWSKTVIPGTHFIEQAINDFMNNYASEYNVKNISMEGV